MPRSNCFKQILLAVRNDSAMMVLHSMPSTFSENHQLAQKPQVRANVLNPIQYTGGDHSFEKFRVCCRENDTPDQRNV